MLPFKATDSSMVEGDCQIQMGRFISFLQVTSFDFLLFFSFFLKVWVDYTQKRVQMLRTCTVRVRHLVGIEL